MGENFKLQGEREQLTGEVDELRLKVIEGRRGVLLCAGEVSTGDATGVGRESRAFRGDIRKCSRHFFEF